MARDSQGRYRHQSQKQDVHLLDLSHGRDDCGGLAGDERCVGGRQGVERRTDGVKLMKTKGDR